LGDVFLLNKSIALLHDKYIKLLPGRNEKFTEHDRKKGNCHTFVFFEVPERTKVLFHSLFFTLKKTLNSKKYDKSVTFEHVESVRPYIEQKGGI
jgi:hypothetical protein